MRLSPRSSVNSAQDLPQDDLTVDQTESEIQQHQQSPIHQRDHYDPLEGHRLQAGGSLQTGSATASHPPSAFLVQDLRSPAPNQSIDPKPGRESFSSVHRIDAIETTVDEPHPSPTRSVPHQPYRCLEPLLPLLDGVVAADVACELLEFYFAQPGSSLFRSASPYVLSHVVRRRSLLHASRPRKTTSALLATILWVSAQTADIPLLLLPGERAKVCEALRKLSMWLVQQRDRDNWDRVPGGKLVEDSISHGDMRIIDLRATAEYQSDPPSATVDDVLTFILLSIVISGGDYKTDCHVWWSKAVRLAQSMGLNREDAKCNGSRATCLTSSCSCRRGDEAGRGVVALEAREERRRVFWLLFCLDRHLALSFNSTLSIWDDECEVYAPLPEEVWESLETAPTELLMHHSYGPPTTVTGTGLFEWFLPLMAILGDVIQVHHRRSHPRFGGLDDHDAVALVEGLLASCAESIADVESRYETGGLDDAIPASEFLTPGPGQQESPLGWISTSSSPRSQRRAQAQLVTAYGTFILHVLHVLLHGKWDAVSMLENDDGWITSVSFVKCASHAIAASEAVSRILRCDPELTFTPYLFGIYLLHGSFILLLFADRMPQLGPNESVETACETIIRAHEVCVVTLNTEFQVSFSYRRSIAQESC